MSKNKVVLTLFYDCNWISTLVMHEFAHLSTMSTACMSIYLNTVHLCNSGNTDAVDREHNKSTFVCDLHERASQFIALYLYWLCIEILAQETFVFKFLNISR